MLTFTRFLLVPDATATAAPPEAPEAPEAQESPETPGPSGMEDHDGLDAIMDALDAGDDPAAAAKAKPAAPDATAKPAAGDAPDAELDAAVKALKGVADLTDQDVKALGRDKVLAAAARLAGQAAEKPPASDAAAKLQAAGLLDADNPTEQPPGGEAPEGDASALDADQAQARQEIHDAITEAMSFEATEDMAGEDVDVMEALLQPTRVALTSVVDKIMSHVNTALQQTQGRREQITQVVEQFTQRMDADAIDRVLQGTDLQRAHPDLKDDSKAADVRKAALTLLKQTAGTDLFGQGSDVRWNELASAAAAKVLGNPLSAQHQMQAQLARARQDQATPANARDTRDGSRPGDEFASWDAAADVLDEGGSTAQAAQAARAAAP